MQTILDIKPAMRSVLLRAWPTFWKWSLFAAVAWLASEYARRDLADSGWWRDGPLFAAAFAIAGRLVYEVLLWNSRRYVLTNEFIRSTSGVLRRTHAEIALVNVRQMVLDRLLGERVLGLGTICITSAGSQMIDVAWVMVPNSAMHLEVIRREVHTAQKARSGERALVIGLSGGIGSGKSEVARILGGLGYLVIDSDKEAKAALERPDVRDTLVRWWGKGVLTESGRVDRRAVSEIVFRDPNERSKLEALIHPLVKSERGTLVARAKAEGRAGVVIDAPLLFEAGSDSECDFVLFIDAPRPMRLERVRRRGWDEAELRRRENSQIPLEAKRERSDIVILNDSDPESLGSRVREALDQLRRKPPRARPGH